MGSSFHCVLIFVLCVSQTYALFEDQIGKWDWRRTFVGRVEHLMFDTSPAANKAPLPVVFVSSYDNVLAAINLQTGELAWRHVFQEEKRSKFAPRITQSATALISLSPDGRLLRSWNKYTGAMQWEVTVSKQAKDKFNYKLFVCHFSRKTSIDYVPTSNDVLVQVDGQMLLFDGLTGKHKDSTKDYNNMNQRWYGMLRLDYGMALLGGEPGSNIGVYQFTMSKTAMHEMPGSMVLAAPWWYRDRCLAVGAFLVCWAEEGKTLAYTDCSINPPMPKGHAVKGANEMLNANSRRYFGVRLEDKTVLILEIDPKNSELKDVLNVGQAAEISEARVSSKESYMVVRTLLPGSTRVEWYSLPAAQRIEKWTLNIKHTDNTVAPTTHMFVRARAGSGAGDVQRMVITLSKDMTLAMYGSANEQLWVRPESLAHAATVDMLDLPLSESQASIETEFSGETDNLLGSFVRRVHSQANQLRRALLHSADQVLHMTGLLPHTGTVTQLLVKLGYFTGGLQFIIANNQESNAHMVGQNQSPDVPFERDYFNQHKLVVVATSSGKIYGLDNIRGRIQWQLWLGEVEPWHASGEPTLPLFVQRSTAHYPHPPQCVIVLRNKVSGKPQLVVFNPMTGKLIERVRIDFELQQVMLTPYTNDKLIQAVLLAGKNNKAMVYPSDVVLPMSPRLYMMTSQVLRHSNNANSLHGVRYVADSESVGRGVMQSVWHTPLALPPHSRLHKIVPKRSAELTHSQGRVLGDRSVLYKYVNPNLVAVTALTEPNKDNADNQLHMFLLDAVTGQVLFSAKHVKAAAPVHIVHCENWIVYSFWNEKGRRTELNVLEMYEGSVQTDADTFSSHTPLVNPPIVMKQAYIFPQGITTLGVSNTIRGLTNRLLLVGLPFGGILELQKAFLDPRRPLNPLPEHREEGIMPYMPEIPVATENIINYNQTVLRLRGVFAAPSGLESTSLMLAYGLDLFFTRLTPSGTFDILKDEFDHWLISVVLAALIGASVVTKKLAKRRDLQNAWR